MARDPSARLDGKVAIVTGGASGIGAAITRGFAEEGAAVTIVDRDGDGARSQVAELSARGLDAGVEVGDVTDAAFGGAVLERLAVREAMADVLVNAAAIRVYRPMLEVNSELVEEHWRVNVLAPIWWMQAVARALIDAGRGGSIINFSSVVASRGYLDNGAYAASKAGLMGFARCAAAELAPHGIRVNAIAPGPTRTPMTREVMEEPEMLARLTRRIPLGRIGEPEDMTGAAVYLASAESAFVTGNTVTVDGGFLVV